VVKEKGAVVKEKGAVVKEKENREFSLRVKERSSKPLVGQIDPFLIKNRGSTEITVKSTTTDPCLTKNQKLYRYRFSKDTVYLPEVLQHKVYDNAEQISQNYPDVVSAIMVIATIVSGISVVLSIFLHYSFRVVLDEDWSQMKKDCNICWNYMMYKSELSLDDDFTPFEQIMVPLVSTSLAICTAVILRFVIKPILRRYGKSTAAAVTIIWYLLMGVGELVLLNGVVTWSTPIQKIGVNLIWLAFDGPYCVYLGSKLMQGKLRLQQSMPVYYFYSTIICMTFLACFSSCLFLKKIHAIRS